MTHLRKLTAGVICGGVLFFCALVAPAFATSKPGYCAATSGDAVDSCQFEVLSYTQAPLPNVSMGIRLDAAVRYVLFNGIPSIGPRFVSNASNNDIFIPQATVGEFSSFLGNLPSLVTADYAVVPTTYTAVPSPVNVACGTATPSVVSILVPIIANTTSPVVVNSYSLVLDSANPSTTQTIVGSTVQGASPVEFTYTRQDCSTDNEGNKNCVTVTFVEDQKLVFSATGSKPDFSWGPPVVTSGIYTNNSPAECSKSYAPPLNGLCGAANGASYTTAPIAGLCSAGNAGSVTASGGIWSWACSGVNGGSNQSCATGVAACTPNSETQIIACASGYTGIGTVQQRDYTCSGETGTWGNWYDKASDCVSSASSCTPTSETRTVACRDLVPVGAYVTGSGNVQQRDYTCSGGDGTWGEWYDTTKTCSSTVCLGNSVNWNRGIAYPYTCTGNVPDGNTQDHKVYTVTSDGHLSGAARGNMGYGGGVGSITLSCVAKHGFTAGMIDYASWDFGADSGNCTKASTIP